MGGKNVFLKSFLRNPLQTGSIVQSSPILAEKMLEKIDFQNVDNPLTNLGIIFSINQILYLLIAVWAYSAVPDKMLMIIDEIKTIHIFKK